MKKNRYSSSQIEQWAVDAVGGALAETDTLHRHIKENDKTPLWDGEVFIYKNRSRANEDLIGKVSIQLKGKLISEKELLKEETLYSVKIVDLLKYKITGGTIFFVVMIDRKNISEKVIYYETLTPQKINNYVKGKEYQKTCTIKLKKLLGGKYKLQTIFYNFSKYKPLSGIKPISLDELSKRKDIDEITSTFTEFLPENEKVSPVDVFLNNETYWTAKLSSYPTPIPIALPGGSVVSFISKKDVIIANEIYVDYVSIIKKKKSTVFKFGDSTTFTILEKKEPFEITYTASDFLKHRIKDLTFLISFLETGEIHFVEEGKLYLGPPDPNDSFNIDNAKNELEAYKRLDQFWESLNVNEDFNIGDIDSNSSLEELNVLIRSMNGKKTVHLNDINNEHKFFLIRKPISNFLLLLLIEIVDESKSLCNVYNYFDNPGRIAIERNDSIYYTPKYSALQPSDYIELNNINYSGILHSFKEIIHLERKNFEAANYCLLDLLLAYDMNKKHRATILETAKDIAGWLLEESADVLPDEIKTINYLQTIKRERELNVEENTTLYNILETSDNSWYKLGANILLENFRVAQIQFDKLSDEEQEEFKKYPINNLWSRPSIQVDSDRKLLYHLQP